MANVLQYDTSTGEVLNILYSVHTPDYKDKEGFIINPSILSKDVQRLKVVDGVVVYKDDREYEKDLKKKARKNHRQARVSAMPDIQDLFEALWDAMHAGDLPKVKGFYDVLGRVYEKHPKS